MVAPDGTVYLGNREGQLIALQADGTYINPQNSLLTTVAVLSPMWVNFNISENEMQQFRDQVAQGRLITPAGREYEVEIVLVESLVVGIAVGLGDVQNVVRFVQRQVAFAFVVDMGLVIDLGLVLSVEINLRPAHLRLLVER